MEQVWEKVSGVTLTFLANLHHDCFFSWTKKKKKIEEAVFTLELLLSVIRESRI